MSSLRTGRTGRRNVGAVAAAAMTLVALLAAHPALACSVCYGNAAAGSLLIDSARLGVFLLLGVVSVVLAAFARFFLYLSKRARQAESDAIAAEWSDLQRSTST